MYLAGSLIMSLTKLHLQFVEDVLRKGEPDQTDLPTPVCWYKANVAEKGWSHPEPVSQEDLRIAQPAIVFCDVNIDELERGWSNTVSRSTIAALGG